jgi:hypothetical protein
MSLLFYNNTGLAKLLLLLLVAVCVFHVVGGGGSTYQGLTHKQRRRPGTRTSYY